MRWPVRVFEVRPSAAPAPLPEQHVEGDTVDAALMAARSLLREQRRDVRALSATQAGLLAYVEPLP